MQPDQAGGPPPPGERPRTVTIACANQKGGTGKTTTTINLAAAFVELGRTVRVVDADPQRGSASLWIPPATAGIGNGLFDVFEGTSTLDAATSATDIDGLYMVPSDVKLRAIEGTPGVGDVLKDAIAASTAPVDYNLIDTVPNTSYLAIGSLAAADYLVVPLQPSLLDREGVDELLAMIDRVRRVYTPHIAVLCFLVTRIKPTAVLDQGLIAYLTERFPDALVHSTPDTVKLREAPGAHEPITTYEPRGKAAKSFRALVKLLEERIKR